MYLHIHLHWYIIQMAGTYILFVTPLIAEPKLPYSRFKKVFQEATGAFPVEHFPDKHELILGFEFWWFNIPRHRNPGNSPGLRKYLGYFLTLGEYTVYSGNTSGIRFLSSCTVFWKQSKVMSKPRSKTDGLLGVPYSGCLDFSSTCFSKNSKNRYWSPETRDKPWKNLCRPMKIQGIHHSYLGNTPYITGADLSYQWMFRVLCRSFKKIGFPIVVLVNIRLLVLDRFFDTFEGTENFGFHRNGEWPFLNVLGEIIEKPIFRRSDYVVFFKVCFAFFRKKSEKNHVGW